jgi:hypothetical protein
MGSSSGDSWWDLTSECDVSMPALAVAKAAQKKRPIGSQPQQAEL